MVGVCRRWVMPAYAVHCWPHWGKPVDQTSRLERRWGMCWSGCILVFGAIAYADVTSTAIPAVVALPCEGAWVLLVGVALISSIIHVVVIAAMVARGAWDGLYRLWKDPKPRFWPNNAPFGRVWAGKVPFVAQ